MRSLDRQTMRTAKFVVLLAATIAADRSLLAGILPAPVLTRHLALAFER